MGLGGQRTRVLEGVPQAWTGRPRPVTDIWEGLAWVRQPLRHSLGPGGGLASAGSRAGGRRRKPGSISLGGRDRPPRPQIAAPGRPVRSAGSTGQAARPGPPPAVGWPKTQATVLSTCPPPSSVCTWGGAGVAPGDCVRHRRGESPLQLGRGPLPRRQGRGWAQSPLKCPMRPWGGLSFHICKTGSTASAAKLPPASSQVSRAPQGGSPAPSPSFPAVPPQGFCWAELYGVGYPVRL